MYSIALSEGPSKYIPLRGGFVYPFGLFLFFSMFSICVRSNDLGLGFDSSILDN